MNTLTRLIISILSPLCVGFTASYFTTPEIPGWYQTINKPAWNPPSYVFAPVWTTLYVMIGIALFLVWKNEKNGGTLKRKAIILFGLQMLLNFLWSFIFFNQHQIGWAFAEILLLWFFIVLTIFAFARISTIAAWLLVPYISWVSFAGILNFTIWQMNR